MWSLMRAIAVVLLLTFNLVVCSSLAFFVYAINCMTAKLVDAHCSHLVDALVCIHAYTIRLVLHYVCGVQIVQQTDEAVDINGQYTIIANHQSHMDILILIAFGVGKLPPLKFFLKRSLMYVPFMGWFCYLMGYPFVDRFSKAQLRQASQRVEQQQALLRDCQALFTQPVGLVVFVEGTRFSVKKANKYRYTHVLPPQSKGLALALSSQVSPRLLNITMAYDKPNTSVWQVLSGQVRRVVVTMVEEDVRVPNLSDQKDMKDLHAWLVDRWLQKDAYLVQRYHEVAAVA